MRVYEAFEVSGNLTEKGQPCSIEFGGKTIATVWVRPADASLNADYRRELADLSIGLAKGKELDENADRELLFRIYARTVVTQWEWTDPADQKDKTLQFNEKNAVALFTKLPKFFEAVQRGSRNWANFRLVHEKEASGN